MPAPIPIGVPSSVPSPTRIALPTIAFSRPPVSLPGGGVISVNSATEKPPNPRLNTVQRIHASQNRPNAMAASDRPSARLLVALRCSSRLTAASHGAFVLRQTQQHPLRQRKHEHGDEEEHQAELHQRGGMQARLRFGELV